MSWLIEITGVDGRYRSVETKYQGTKSEIVKAARAKGEAVKVIRVLGPEKSGTDPRKTVLADDLSANILYKSAKGRAKRVAKLIQKDAGRTVFLGQGKRDGVAVRKGSDPSLIAEVVEAIQRQRRMGVYE